MKDINQKHKEDRLYTKNLTNSGDKITIIEYYGCRNCTIQFEDGTLLYNLEYSKFKKGCIDKPVFRVGEIFYNSYGESMEIIEYINSKKCTIKFNDGKVLENINYRNLKKGQVKKRRFSYRIWQRLLR